MLRDVTSVEHGAPLRVADGGALDPLVGPQCSLAVQLRRATGAVIGRSAELDAISQELREASGRLAAVTLEGEPGIGKTRLLLATAELASASGFTCVAITADEEIRGPFLVARSLFASSSIRDTAAGTPAEAAVNRVIEAISGRDERGFESLLPDAKLLRAFDLAGVAVATLATLRPLALLIDDVQWADDDTLRLLRYVVRSDADRPIFLFLTIRPDEFASVTEAVNFVADMERMGLVRRLRPGRFSSVETGELLKRVLGGPVEATSAAAMHVQSEGVPFIVEELARTHREAGTLQQIDGEWRLARNAARLVPSAVRTLIDRRAARLPAGTRAALGDAAILGRSFSLRDLRAIRARIGEGDVVEPAQGATTHGVPTHGESRSPGDGADSLADDLAPAVAAGLLLPQAQGEPADYTFTHEQVRQFAANQLSAARRRQVHAAVVDLLLDGGDPDPAGLPMLAQHALAAGDTARAARFSIDAAAAALASNAPEEALRLVEQALPVVATPADRRVLLATRDDAYAILRRTGERLDGLTELAALAEAMRDPAIELDVQLRRASALRMSHDEDAAAELARRVRTRAAERGDAALELRATLELGQALLRSPLGESFGGAAIEIDIDAADEAYRRAIVLAEQMHDDHSLAAALREIGTIDFAKGRAWFSGEVRSGRAGELLAMLASGASIEEMILASPIGPLFIESTQVLDRALFAHDNAANYAAAVNVTGWTTGTPPGPTAAVLSISRPSGVATTKLTVGARLDFDASHSYAGPGKTFSTATLDYGDSTPPETFTGDSWNWVRSHSYSTTGPRTVTLTVTDSAGVTVSDVLTVTVFDAPTAKLVSNGPAQVGAPVRFDLTSSTPAGTDITSYDLNVLGADGTKSYGGNGSPLATKDLIFTSPGTYEVQFSVSNDAGGLSAMDSMTIDVAGATTTPVLSIGSSGVDTTTITVGGTLLCVASDTYAGPGVTLASVVLDYGDNSALTVFKGNQAYWFEAHSYSSPGKYPVTLTVTDSANVTVSKVVTVTVSPVPTAAITIEGNPTSVHAGSPVTFTLASSTPPGTATQSWSVYGDWLDGGYGTAPPATVMHTFRAPGTYTVQFNYGNDAMGTAQSSMEVTVVP